MLHQGNLIGINGYFTTLVICKKAGRGFRTKNIYIVPGIHTVENILSGNSIAITEDLTLSKWRKNTGHESCTDDPLHRVATYRDFMEIHWELKTKTDATNLDIVFSLNTRDKDGNYSYRRLL